MWRNRLQNKENNKNPYESSIIEKLNQNSLNYIQNKYKQQEDPSIQQSSQRDDVSIPDSLLDMISSQAQQAQGGNPQQITKDGALLAQEVMWKYKQHKQEKGSVGQTSEIFQNKETFGKSEQTSTSVSPIKANKEPLYKSQSSTDNEDSIPQETQSEVGPKKDMNSYKINCPESVSRLTDSETISRQNSSPAPQLQLPTRKKLSRSRTKSHRNKTADTPSYRRSSRQPKSSADSYELDQHQYRQQLINDYNLQHPNPLFTQNPVSQLQSQALVPNQLYNMQYQQSPNNIISSFIMQQREEERQNYIANMLADQIATQPWFQQCLQQDCTFNIEGVRAEQNHVATSQIQQDTKVSASSQSAAMSQIVQKVGMLSMGGIGVGMLFMLTKMGLISPGNVLHRNDIQLDLADDCARDLTYHLDKSQNQKKGWFSKEDNSWYPPKSCSRYLSKFPKPRT